MIEVYYDYIGFKDFDSGCLTRERESSYQSRSLGVYREAVRQNVDVNIIGLEDAWRGWSSEVIRSDLFPGGVTQY
ncbi:hypothetical protein LINPERHAP1_LOCUS4468 [Linum perenne]